MNPHPVTLRLAFQGYTAHMVGLSAVFYLPNSAPCPGSVGLPPLRLAHHLDASLTIQAMTLPSRWIDLLWLYPLEMVVE